MELDIQFKLMKNTKMKKYLKENSYWYKYLNRNPNNYDKFITDMKDKYKLRPTDKINSAIENIELVNSVLNVIKD